MEVTVILRNALLLSTVLSNCESWYNLALSDIEEMEAVDGGLIQRTLEKTFSTHKEMLFLELGIIPIRFIIYSRKKKTGKESFKRRLGQYSQRGSRCHPNLVGF